MRVTPPQPVRSAPSHPDMGVALLQGLNVPLSALRAFMEALGREMNESDPRSPALSGALEEVDRCVHAVQLLVEYSTPPRPMPLQCTVEEIVQGARKRLPAELRERLLIAREGGRRSIFVDGPLLAKSLSRLIQNGFESGSSWVLLRIRSNEDSTSFITINHDPRDGVDWEWAQSAFRTDKRDHMGLGLTLVKRDIGLMGGTLALSRTPLGETCADVRIHDARGSGGADH